MNDMGKTASGIQANLGALLCYTPYIGIIASLLFVILEKESKYVRFHAIQSLIVSVFFIVVCGILGVVPIVGGLVLLIALAGFILSIYLMYQAYQGEYLKLPVAGDIAEKNS